MWPARLENGRKLLTDAGIDRVDYLEVRDAETLEPVNAIGRRSRLFAAIYIGKTRLIDNIPIPSRNEPGDAADRRHDGRERADLRHPAARGSEASSTTSRRTHHQPDRPDEHHARNRLGR